MQSHQYMYLDSAVSPSSVGSIVSGQCPTGLSPCKADYVPLQRGEGLSPPVGSEGLKRIGNQAYFDTQAQIPVTALDLQCCPNPAPCQEQISWRNTWKGCPYTYFADRPAQQCEVNPYGDRYWVADLDPVKYEMSIAMAAEQNPYNFLNARQALMQFLMKDVVQQKDPYTRPIADLDNSYCMKLKTQGPPRYTTF